MKIRGILRKSENGRMRFDGEYLSDELIKNVANFDMEFIARCGIRIDKDTDVVVDVDYAEERIEAREGSYDCS